MQTGPSPGDAKASPAQPLPQRQRDVGAAVSAQSQQAQEYRVMIAKPTIATAVSGEGTQGRPRLPGQRARLAKQLHRRACTASRAAPWP
jgi:hypothetical protein